MPIIVSHGTMTAARLFKRCREALGLTTEQMQDALCMMDLTTILKIERGAIDVHGPTWVAIQSLLDRRLSDCLDDDGDLRGDVDPGHLTALASEVQRYIEAIQGAAQQRRATVRERRALSHGAEVTRGNSG